MAAVTAVTVLSAVGLIVAVAAAAAFILRRIAQSALKAACNDQDAYPAASSSIQQHGSPHRAQCHLLNHPARAVLTLLRSSRSHLFWCLNWLQAQRCKPSLWRNAALCLTPGMGSWRQWPFSHAVLHFKLRPWLSSVDERWWEHKSNNSYIIIYYIDLYNDNLII